ncbi:CHAT domain-containing protein [Nonomuraea jabiensis]|uniref:CHAT domain-containing protein n=1 Tax=Nonomuraea jabiensis TaxID=882448 RepID=UPI0034338B3E
MTEPARALAARIERFEQAADPDLIWDPAALVEAEQAMRACAGDRTDAVTWRLIGMLHLARYRLDQRFAQDAAVAGTYFAAVAVVDPARLPERLRGSNAPPGDSAGTWAGLVEEVFQHVDPEAYPHVGLLIHALVRRAMARPTPEVADRLGELLLRQSARSPGPAWAPGALALLGEGLLRLFGATGELEVVDDAVHVLFRAALAEPAHVDELGTALGLAAFGDEELAMAYVTAAQAPPAGQERSQALLALVELTWARAAGSYSDRDLLAFIRVGQCALDFWHEEWAHPGVLAPYAAGLVEWFVVTGDERSLEAGTEMLEALHMTPGETARGLGTDPVVRLGLLGDRRWNRYGVTGDSGDLETAVEVMREAAGQAPRGHPDRARLLANLANALLRRAVMTGGDPAEPIAAARAALAAHGERDPARPRVLMLLGQALRLDLDDGRADEAIAALREALAAGEGLSTRAEAYGLVSEVLRWRAAHSGRVEDLHEAVASARQGLELAVKSAQDPAPAQRVLCGALLARFSAQGDPGDLGEVLELAREGDPKLLSQLGAALDGTPPPDERLAGAATELALAARDDEVTVELLRYAERQAESPGEFLLETGLRLASLGRRRVACAVLGRSAEAFGSGAPARMAYALAEQGRAYQELGELGAALESFARSAAGYGSLGEVRAEALQLGNMGVVLLAAGDPVRALEHHHRAIALCESAGLAAEEAAQQGHAAEAFLAAGDPDGAVACAVQARELYRELGETVPAAMALVHAARAAVDQDDLTAAAERMAACAIELEAAGAWEDACRVLDAHAVLLVERGHPGQAAACETRLVEIVRRRGERREPADEWYRIAGRRRARGDADGARTAFGLAEREYESLGHYDGAASARYNLGALSYAEGEPGRALEEFGAAAEAFARLRVPVKEASALTMRASCLTALDRYDDALADLERALELAAAEGDVGAVLVAVLGRVAVDLRLGSWDEAAERLSSALGLSAGDPLKEAVVRDRLAALAARTGDLDAQVEALELAVAGFCAGGQPGLAALTSIKLGFALEERGEFRRARAALEAGLSTLTPPPAPPDRPALLDRGAPFDRPAPFDQPAPLDPRASLGRSAPFDRPTPFDRTAPHHPAASPDPASPGGSASPGESADPTGSGQPDDRGGRAGPAAGLGDSAQAGGGAFELIAVMGGGLDAELLSRLARIQLTLGEATRGHATLNQAIRAADGDRAERLETWLRIEEAEAAGDLETARALAEQTLAANPVNGRPPASDYHSFLLVKLSSFCRALGDPGAAHAYAARGHELRDALVIDHLRNLGAAARDLGRLDEAADHLTEAVALARDSDAALPADLVQALDLLGRVRTDQARWAEAAHAFDEGLELLSSPVWRALRAPLLAGRGGLHLKLGELAEAEALYRQSIAIVEEAGSRTHLADSYADLSLVCALRNSTDQARLFAERALDIEHARGRTRGVVLALILLARLEDSSRAEVDLAEAAALAQEIGYRPGEALALGRLGALYVTTTSYARAHRHLSEAIGLLEELGHELELGIALHNRSVAAEQLGDLPSALADAERACALGHTSGRNRAIRLAVRLSRGLAAWRHLEHAKSHTLTTHLGHHHWPGPERGGDARWSGMAGGGDARWSGTVGDGGDRGFRSEGRGGERWAEPARPGGESWPWTIEDRPTAADLSHRRWPVPDGVPAELVAAERRGLDTMQTLRSAARNTRDPAEAAALLRRARTAEAEVEELWRRMEPLAPDYVALHRHPPLDQLHLDALVTPEGRPGSRIAVVGFHVGEQSVTVLAHRTGWPEPRAIPTTVGHDLLADFTATTAGRRPGLLDIEARRHRAAVWRRLADLLLSDALDALGDDLDHLYLVPHAELHRVPLHALAPNGRSLLDRAPVTYAPSVATLTRLTRRGPATGTRSLVLGYTPRPVSGSESEARAVSEGEVGPEVRGVLEAAARDAGALLGVPPHTGPAATAARLPGTWDVVQLSCPGVFDPDDPFGSGIGLADGLLTGRRLMSMAVNARLVVLGSHERGPTPGGGHDAAALAYAFLHAGARSVLLPLWPVSAEVTSALMRDVHTRLRSGMDPAQALREAVLELCDLYGPAEPDLWASYVLVGLPS